MVECCGVCSGNQDLQDTAETIRDKLSSGQLVTLDDGTTDWWMYTAPDSISPSGTTRCWSSGSDANYIVLNGLSIGGYGPSSDPQVGALMIGAMLAHELFHCSTLTATSTLVSGVWGPFEPACSYYENECFAYNLEELLINCILSCGCCDPTSFTAPGNADLTRDLARISTEKAHWCGLFGICPP